jgi:outer membrane protein assembly factor BamB
MSVTRYSVSAAVVAFGLLLVSAGCSGGRPEAAPSSVARSSAAPSTPATSAGGAARFGDRPLWGRRITEPWPLPSGTVTLVEAHSFDIVDDALVTVGTRQTEDDNASQQVIVSDVRTGATRWSVYGGDPLGPDGAAFHALTPRAVLDRDGDWKLLVQYVQPGSGRRARTYTEIGVMALSGKDGHVVWKAPVHRVARRGIPVHSIDDTVTSDRAVLVTTSDLDSARRFAVTALNPATGAKLWTSHGMRARFVTGDVVLVERPILPIPVDPYRVRTTVAAVRLDNGATAWDTTRRYAEARQLQVTGDAAVVDVEPGSVVLDAATGRELATTDRDLKLCSADHGGPVTCTVVTSTGPTQKHLAIVERSGAGVRITDVPNSGGWVLSDTWKGQLFCVADSGGDRWLTLDRSGNTVDIGVPGQMYAISDEFAVFSPTSVDRYAQGEFAVYAKAG